MVARATGPRAFELKRAFVARQKPDPHLALAGGRYGHVDSRRGNLETVVRIVAFEDEFYYLSLLPVLEPGLQQA